MGDNWGLHRWYYSKTTGEIVKTIGEVIRHAAFNLFKFRLLDFRWTVVWLNQ